MGVISEIGVVLVCPSLECGGDRSARRQHVDAYSLARLPRVFVHAMRCSSLALAAAKVLRVKRSGAG